MRGLDLSDWRKRTGGAVAVAEEEEEEEDGVDEFVDFLDCLVRRLLPQAAESLDERHKRVCRVFIKAYRDGKLGRYTLDLPPPSPAKLKLVGKHSRFSHQQHETPDDGCAPSSSSSPGPDPAAANPRGSPEKHTVKVAGYQDCGFFRAACSAVLARRGDDFELDKHVVVRQADWRPWVAGNADCTQNRHRTSPAVWIDGAFVGGCDELELLLATRYKAKADAKGSRPSVNGW
jgi:glutaredoxin-related protein